MGKNSAFRKLKYTLTIIYNFLRFTFYFIIFLCENQNLLIYFLSFEKAIV